MSTNAPRSLMISMYFFSLTRIWMNKFWILITVMSLFSLALTTLVKMMESLATVGEEASYLGIFVRCLLPLSTVFPWIFLSLLIEKHVGLQHHLPFFVCQVTPMHGNEHIPDVQKFHFSLGCWMSLLSPLIHASIEGYLGHDCYHSKYNRNWKER